MRRFQFFSSAPAIQAQALASAGLESLNFGFVSKRQTAPWSHGTCEFENSDDDFMRINCPGSELSGRPKAPILQQILFYERELLRLVLGRFFPACLNSKSGPSALDATVTGPKGLGPSRAGRAWQQGCFAKPRSANPTSGAANPAWRHQARAAGAR